MEWQYLKTMRNSDAISHGAVFRVKGKWPYESLVDFMLIDMPDENTKHALIVSTGKKAGLILVRLPVEAESSEGNALSKEWILQNWARWIYPECLVEEVLFLPRYDVENE